jgi:beta-lactam-binding protein with PASTA domain
MSFKKFLASRVFFTNLIIAVILIGGLLFVTLQSLKSYTRHGQTNPVPDFTGLVQHEAEVLATQNILKVVIIDSVFTDKVKPGGVIEQVPEPGFGVKENRTIFLTINSTTKEMVALPKLTDISFRQAQVLVENYGLTVGEIFYQPSEYNNLVLKVEQDSLEVLPGKLILKGSRIDFFVGRDPENKQTPLPNLKGFQIEEAQNILTDAMLNFGVLIYDETILSAEDSINAIIWQQRPEPKTNSSVKLGTSVDLWITVDEEKINKAKELEF